MNIVIVGGGKVAAHLITLLAEEAEHHICVVERRRETSMHMADTHDVQVINGDGSDLMTLEMAGAAEADMIICLTGEDETNLLTCQIAKMHFNVPTTVSRVNNANNMPVFRLLGVDKIYCGTKILADIIDQEINYAGMRLAFDIPESDMGILEFFLDPRSDAVGQRLMDYSFPGNSKVVLVTRENGKVEMPTGDLVMKAHDRMLIVAEQKNFESVWTRMVDKEATLS